MVKVLCETIDAYKEPLFLRVYGRARVIKAMNNHIGHFIKKIDL